MLHPDAGLPDDAGGDVVRPAAPLEQLVTDAHDQRQGQPGEKGYHEKMRICGHVRSAHAGT